MPPGKELDLNQAPAHYYAHRWPQTDDDMAVVHCGRGDDAVSYTSGLPAFLERPGQAELMLRRAPEDIAAGLLRQLAGYLHWSERSLQAGNRVRFGKAVFTAVALPAEEAPCSDRRYLRLTWQKDAGT